MARQASQVRAEQARNARTVPVQVRLDRDDAELLDKVASGEGLSRQGWVTQVVKRALARASRVA